MVTLGGDSHKRTHTLVAVDQNGRQLAQKTLLATKAGHLEALHSGQLAGHSGNGLWRIAGMYRGGSRLTCWLQGNSWFGCRQS